MAEDHSTTDIRKHKIKNGTVTAVKSGTDLSRKFPWRRLFGFLSFVGLLFLVILLLKR